MPKKRKTATELRIEAFKASKARGAKPSRAGVRPKALAPDGKARRAPVQLPSALTPRSIDLIQRGLTGTLKKKKKK